MVPILQRLPTKRALLFIDKSPPLLPSQFSWVIESAPAFVCMFRDVLANGLDR